MATSETWTDKETGERKENTQWHNITVFNEGLVGVVKKYIRTGAMLHIEGALRHNKWTDKDGIERYNTEVVLQGYDAGIIMLDKKKGE